MKKIELVLLVIVLCLTGNNTFAQQWRPVRCPPDSGCVGVYVCPPGCPRTCLMDCNTCKSVCGCDYPGAVCQDPRFIGGDGITFYFHGRKDQHFCLVSDSNLHINAGFIGKRNPKLKRDFTWVQAIGVMFNKHKLLIAAQKTPTWDDSLDRLSISFDEKPICLPPKAGSKWDSHKKVSISRTRNTNGVVVEVADIFKVTVNVVPITAEESRAHGYGITDEDCFAHLEVGFKFYNLSDAVDGVLGQTYRRNYQSRVKVNAIMPVMGGEHKFRTRGIFDTNCQVSRFGTRSETVATLEGLKCNSGMQGNGIVCN